MTVLTITQGRKALLDLPKRLAKDPKKTVCITRHGRSVLAVMQWELYESLVEALEVLSDPDTTVALQASVEDIRKGRLVTHETARRRLGG